MLYHGSRLELEWRVEVKRLCSIVWLILVEHRNWGESCIIVWMILCFRIRLEVEFHVKTEVEFHVHLTLFCSRSQHLTCLSSPAENMYVCLLLIASPVNKVNMSNWAGLQLLPPLITTTLEPYLLFVQCGLLVWTFTSLLLSPISSEINNR